MSQSKELRVSSSGEPLVDVSRAGECVQWTVTKASARTEAA